MMLKIHKLHSNKLLTISITSILSISALLGFSALTYTPELSHAETVFYPEPRPDLSTITYMQDITSEICTNTKEADTAGNYQYFLKDSRDQITYWVAKLKDGNCWMTQNLDLDLWNNGTNTGVKLTSEDSDMPEGKEWISTTGRSGTWKVAQNRDGDDFAVAGYYDVGYSYYCGNNTTDKCNLINSKNSGHDAQGNYYTWGAATAGQSYDLINAPSGTIATQSICPKNWSLPLAGADCSGIMGEHVCSYDKTNGSFRNMLQRYGFIYGVNNGTSNSIFTAPIYWVDAGTAQGVTSTSTTGTVIFGNASQGMYWSSVNFDSLFAYMPFTSWGSMINLYNSTNKTSGVSVRCYTTGKHDVDNVRITVNPTISLDVASEVEIGKGENEPSTVDLNVRVASNQPYSVSISSGSPELKSETSGVTIPSNGGALTVNVNNWGIMKPNESTYTKVTTSPELFYQATAPGVNDILFKIGISTAPDLPNGEYSTEITVTATQN